MASTIQRAPMVENVRSSSPDFLGEAEDHRQNCLMTHNITRRHAIMMFLLVPTLAACGSSDATGSASTVSSAPNATPAGPALSSSTADTTTLPPSSPATASPSPLSGSINVLAASSLTASFKEAGAAFEAANPGVKVTFNFAGSSTLAQQILQGAPGDVFASADASNMQKIIDAGTTASAPITFATNKLQIIVAKGNPNNIRAVADLADNKLIVVSAGPEVPIGKYTQQVFDNAGIAVTPKSLEPDVKAIVSKVTIGEADAGIVYATDVLAAAGKADGVVIPDDINVTATYPISVLKDTKSATTAAAFVAFIATGEGHTVLSKYGFTK
jgi:molybdate transport system substrate-binding protein